MLQLAILLIVSSKPFKVKDCQRQALARLHIQAFSFTHALVCLSPPTTNQSAASYDTVPVVAGAVVGGTLPQDWVRGSGFRTTKQNTARGLCSGALLRERRDGMCAGGSTR